MVKRKKVKKKVMKKAAPKKEPVYVQLSDPATNRRMILQTAIDAAKLIQDYEILRALKKEKESVLSQFHKVVTETKKLTGKLIGGALPKIKEDAKPQPVKSKEPPKIERMEEPVFTPEPVIESQPAPMSEVERLQQELGDIESKLAKL
jgi:hypothetical protein